MLIHEKGQFYDLKNWKLVKVSQCCKCPWKKSTNPNEIPNEYSVEKHIMLVNTIADPETSNVNDPLIAMACHESFNQEPYHCIGWLMNQVRDGGNIPLRKSMLFCQNSGDIELNGEQHRSFWDTLPADWSERINE